MNCPRCNTSMKKTQKGNHTLDTCDNCGGIWFDDNEMIATVELPGGISENTTTRAVQTTSGYNKTISCPCCHKPTVEKNYLLNSNIFIDVCESCRGMFLDAGELETIFHYLIKADMFEPIKKEEESTFFSVVKDFFKKNKILNLTKKRTCPRCHNTLMEVNFSGETVDYCVDCGGMWFDRKELGDALDVSQTKKGLEENDITTDLTLSKTDDQIMLCPVCDNTYLNKHNYMSTSQIVVDSCKQCLGVWLDKDEFQQILAYNQASRNADDLCLANQALFTQIKKEHQVWKEKNNQIYVKALKSMLPGGSKANDRPLLNR